MPTVFELYTDDSGDFHAMISNGKGNVLSTKICDNPFNGNDKDHIMYDLLNKIKNHMDRKDEKFYSPKDRQET